MLEYIYVSRHGFRSNWVDPTIKTGPTKMTRDPPLAAYGVEQAGVLGDFLASPPDPYPVPEMVFSSPFYRCIQTAVPLAQRLGKQVMLEHGAMEWYSTVNPDTGLHPRPGSPETLQEFFPPSIIDTTYNSTVFPSRKGETLKEIHDRAKLFVEAWTNRVESLKSGVKCVSLYSHAASVIAIGRALTGDPALDVKAGCASTSLYRRKTTHDGAGSAGVGQWEIVWNGEAGYLVNGLERNWSFNDVVLKDDGEVISDNGDLQPHTEEDELPVGLGPEMDRFLVRGHPQGEQWASARDRLQQSSKM